MESQEPRFPLLLLGAGRMGRAWLQALASRSPEAEGAEIAAVCDPDPAAGSAALALEKGDVLADLDRALERVDPAGAILATPPHTHPALALRLLEAGIPVLCEKPLAPDLEQAREMLQSARDKGLPLHLASKYRFCPDVKRAGEILASGVLGEPVAGLIYFSGYFPVEGTWRVDPALSGGGVLADNAPHAVDLARLLLGEVEGALAFPLPRVQEIPVEDSAWVHFRHNGNKLTAAFLSWSLSSPHPWYCQVECSEGTLLLGWRESKYHVKDAPDWVVFGEGFQRDRALASMAGAFARAVRGEEPFPMSEADALATARISAAAVRSLETGGMEEIP